MSLKVHTASAEQIKSKEDSAPICVICLSELSGDALRTLTCYHTFHSECIAKALNENNRCPICRRQSDDVPAPMGPFSINASSYYSSD